MWWRFRKHKLAMISAVVLLFFYASVALADFLAYSDPEASEAQRGLIAPQPIHWFADDGSFYPHVYGLVGKRDPVTFKRVYVPDPDSKVPVTFFAAGLRLQAARASSRRIATCSASSDGAKAEKSLFLLGTDIQGRDSGRA